MSRNRPSPILPSCLASMIACAPAPEAPPQPTVDPPAPTDTAAPSTTDSLPPWVHSGDEGSLVYRHQSEGGGLRSSHLVAGLFGADLQGLPVPALCALEGELCYATLPGPGEVLVDPPSAALDPDRADPAWMGDVLVVGPYELPFEIDEDSGLAYYLEEPDDFPDAEALAVSMDGEWGPFSADDVLPVPGGLTLTSHDPEVFVDLDGTGPVTFTWADGPGEVYADITGPDGLHELRHVSGSSLTFDPAPLGPLDNGDVVQIDLHRLHTMPLDIHGNTLDAVAAEHVRILGGSAEPASCLGWLSRDPGAISGVFPVQPTPDGPTFDVWCDMETDGGGWTLVGASNGATLDDAAGAWHGDLTTPEPAGSHTGVWDGLRQVITGPGDLRFVCRADAADPATTVDLSFYDVGWYREITRGTDADSCFNEDDGAGADPAPERRDNLTGETLPAGDPWDAGFLEGEDACDAGDDFTVDFDDRGMDGNQSDGTDWGEDDGAPKCGTSGTFDGVWLLFAREG